MNQTNVDKSKSIEDRIAFLKECANLYETNGDSPISDKDYDEEYYDLQQLDPNNPFFDEVGGLSQEHVYGTQVKHDLIMGSLNKSLDIPSFKVWLESQFENIETLEFIIQHKIDGLSLALHYNKGKLEKALTRGDGVTGVDVTENAKYVKGVPLTIPSQESVEIRGECFKDREDFYKKWHTSVGGEYANPRNFSSGSMNQKDPKVTQERGLSFIGYECVKKEFEKETDKNQWLEEQGFETLNPTTKKTKVGLSYDQIAKGCDLYMKKIDRSKLPYDIDGVVFKVNDITLKESMGYVSGGRKAKANRAIKFPPEEKDTILIDVETNVGRTGNLTPVAILKPVELGGAMISRATLHNFGAIVSDGLKINSVVTIAKKGDIIPQIIKVKSVGDTDIDLPTECPSCGSKISWDSTKVNLVCLNQNCVSQLNSKIEHWFKKLGTKGIGKGIISRLTDQDQLVWEGKPIISSLPEMYYMLDNDRRSEHPFRKYNYLKEQFGEKAFSNIIESVKSVNEITLAKFIEALGIGKIGTMAKDIVAIAPTIDDIDNLTVSQIASIDGFAEKKAEGFVEGWKALRSEIKTLLKYVKIIEEKKSSDKLVGKKFCFTGSFSKGRKEMQAIVQENGGDASSSVGKGVILVWDGSEQGSKYNKAVANGNDIISEEDFFEMLG
jgi:DNA ligase (NAD+)